MNKADKADKAFNRVMAKVDKLYGTTDSDFDFTSTHGDGNIHKQFSIIKDKKLRKEFITKWLIKCEEDYKEREQYEKPITLPKKVNYFMEIKGCLLFTSILFSPHFIYEFFWGEGNLFTWNVGLFFLLVFAWFFYQPIKESKVLNSNDKSHNEDTELWFIKNTDTRDWIVKLKKQLDLIELD